MKFIVMTDQKKLYAYKFDYKILKLATKITKIPITVKKVVAYLQRASFFAVPKFLSFLGPQYYASYRLVFYKKYVLVGLLQGFLGDILKCEWVEWVIIQSGRLFVLVIHSNQNDNHVQNFQSPIYNTKVIYWAC